MQSINKALGKDSQLRLIGGSLLIIIGLMPFHGLISTWLGSIFGYEDVFKAWKEILLVAAAFAVLQDGLRHKAKFKKFLSSTLNKLIILYSGLYLLIFILNPDDLDAAAASLAFNLRFLVIFLIAQWLAIRHGNARLAVIGLRLLVAATAIVSLFALAQVTILPDDFLSSFGFNDDTIPATFTLDDNDSIQRASGTTRGPNALGVMLVIPFSFLISRLLKDKDRRRLIGIAFFSLTLFFTYSRSGWLAALTAAAILVWLSLPAIWQRRSLIFGAPLAAIGITLIVINASSSSTLSRLILHDDPNTGQISSNQQRIDVARDAVEDILNEPLGSGPGTAGPSSFYNEDQGIRIPENYYLQVGQEVGILGMALFVSIVSITGLKLWNKRDKMLPRILFASLAGLSLAALFMQTWADEEIALTWWALAGFFVIDD